MEAEMNRERRNNFDLVFDVFIRENDGLQTAVLEYLNRQGPK